MGSNVPFVHFIHNFVRCFPLLLGLAIVPRDNECIAQVVGIGAL